MGRGLALLNLLKIYADQGFCELCQATKRYKSYISTFIFTSMSIFSPKYMHLHIQVTGSQNFEILVYF
jgi:hypothetical protein